MQARYSATILPCRQRIAALSMVCTPRRRGKYLEPGLLLVLSATLLAQQGVYPPSPATPGAPGNYKAQSYPTRTMPGNTVNGVPQADSGAPTGPTTKSSTAQSRSSLAEQYPARPPRVVFRDGQLTITAENSTLPDILAAIHQRTGAAMELPANLGNERVAVKLGPAATDEVLAALLNGSHFDYIVLNHPDNPLTPERIILREKTAPDASGASGGFNGMASGQPAYQQVETQEMPETVPEEEPPPAAPGGNAENPNAMKTPEQLLQEIQQMKQRQGQQPPQPQPQLVPQQPPLTDNNNQPQNQPPQ